MIQIASASPVGFHPIEIGYLLRRGVERCVDGLTYVNSDWPEEWDIAIFWAHLFLSNTPIELIRSALDLFHKTGDFDDNKFAGYLGMEILRRLLGLAQVPVEMDLGQKAQLIEQSINWIKTGKIDVLTDY